MCAVNEIEKVPVLLKLLTYLEQTVNKKVCNRSGGSKYFESESRVCYWRKVG